MSSHRASERGSSLPEVLVVVLLLGIIMAAFYNSFESVQKTSSRIDARMEHLAQAQALMRAVRKDVRTATNISSSGTAFILAGPTQMRFYAYLDQGYGTSTTPALPVPELVRLWVDNSDPLKPVLREETKEADTPVTTPPTYVGTQPTKLRLLGTYIYNQGTAEPIFRYLDYAGTELIPVSGDLSAADKLRVRSVVIELRVKRSTSGNVKPTTVRTKVRLPNVIFGVAPGT
jgi:prepilin-type N-terminal cleavage/methylation domain-containing protein